MRRIRSLTIALTLLALLAGPGLAATLFNDDFTGSSPGWAWSAGDGGASANAVNFNFSGVLYAVNNGGPGGCCGPEFPLVGRNDLFNGINAYWRLSLRFRYSEVTAYGTNIGVGTGTFDANSRLPYTSPARTDWGNLLGIHQVAQPGCAFTITAYGTTWYNADICPGDRKSVV